MLFALVESNWHPLFYLNAVDWVIELFSFLLFQSCFVSFENYDACF